MKVSLTRSIVLTAALVGLSSLSITTTVSASATAASAAANSTESTAATQKRLQNIIGKGDLEISRRLKTLATLTTKINGATKLSTSDKATLSSEVSTEVSNLNTLKTKLDSETTIAGAAADAQSIFSDYRVYALIVPKIQLVRTADDQQVTEAKLTDLATKLQTRITAAQTAGKDVTALQPKLTDLTSQTKTAQGISAGVEAAIINLQPSDYNGDHTVLSGYATQLKTAHTANAAAYADAKTIVAGLKGL